MAGPPSLPMEVIAQIIPHLKRSTRKSTGRAAVVEKFHQKDLAKMMRVSRSVQELTAKHLYGEIVVSDLSRLIFGHDRPQHSPSTTSIEASDSPSAIRKIHKQALLDLVTTLHFTYSKAGKKSVREARKAHGKAPGSMYQMTSAIYHEATRFDNFEIWLDRMKICVTRFFPNLHRLTYSTWQLRPDYSLATAALQPDSRRFGETLATYMMRKVESHTRPPYHLEAIEKGMGGAGQGLEAAHICRIHCEGPASKRLSRQVVPGKVLKNVIHDWDLVEIPHLILGAENHIIVHRFPNVHLFYLIIGSALTMGEVLFAPVWKELLAGDPEDTTTVTLHIRQHLSNGLPVAESEAEYDRLINAVKDVAMIGDLITSGWLGRFKISAADPTLRCEACGKLYDPSATDTA